MAILVLGLLAIALLSGTARAQTYTADWTNLGLGSIVGVPDGASITAGTGSGTRTVTITHSQITDGGPFTNFYGTEMVNYYSGTIGAQTGTLLYSIDNSSFDADDRFESVYTFDSSVTDLAFSLSHVDRGNSPRHDGVTIEYDTGSGSWQNIRSIPSVYSLGSVVGTTTLSGVAGFHGTGSAGGLTSLTGNIDVDFGAISVERVRITYHFGQNEPGDPAGNLQYMSLSDFTYTAPLPASYADLSLTKSVSDSSPANGAAVSYTITVSNSVSSPSTATGVVVNDLLPIGASFVSSSDPGNYDNISGIWTVGSLSPGTVQSLTINATVTATSGATVTNSAEVTAASVFDIDSTPNNGATGEDDYDDASFTVAGTRVAGTPPNLSSICSLANQILFDWNGKLWTTGSTNNNFTVTGIGITNFSITTDVAFVTGSPTINSTNVGGNAATEQSLFLNMNNNNQSDTSTTVLTLPTAVPGLQFTLFDVDFGAGQWADKVTVTGTYNGATVIPTLTNGTANYVVGNTAIGDVGSDGPDPDGNVVVTFLTPVDSVSIEYGNHTTAPTNPGNQFMNVYDFNYCAPQTTFSVMKISSVISDPVSIVDGTSIPKSIPGAIVEYCILISNTGSATATDIVATDNLTGNYTYTAESMQSRSNCNAAGTVEDDDASDGGEGDGVTASVVGTLLTTNIATLGPAESAALTFRVTVD